MSRVIRARSLSRQICAISVSASRARRLRASTFDRSRPARSQKSVLGSSSGICLQYGGELRGQLRIAEQFGQDHGREAQLLIGQGAIDRLHVMSGRAG